MATTPTNLPVPSESPRDLKFNAGKIDEFVTSENHVYVDRFGNKHRTIEGINYDANQAMLNYGYITKDSFEDGSTISLANECLRWESNGEYYRWDGTLPKVVPPGSTPDSTGGIGKGKWLSVGDASLRAALAAPGGIRLIGGEPLIPVTAMPSYTSSNVVQAWKDSVSEYGYVYFPGNDGTPKTYTILNTVSETNNLKNSKVIVDNETVLSFDYDHYSLIKTLSFSGHCTLHFPGKSFKTTGGQVDYIAEQAILNRNPVRVNKVNFTDCKIRALTGDSFTDDSPGTSSDTAVLVPLAQNKYTGIFSPIGLGETISAHVRMQSGTAQQYGVLLRCGQGWVLIYAAPGASSWSYRVKQVGQSPVDGTPVSIPGGNVLSYASGKATIGVTLQSKTMFSFVVNGVAIGLPFNSGLAGEIYEVGFVTLSSDSAAVSRVTGLCSYVSLNGVQGKAPLNILIHGDSTAEGFISAFDKYLPQLMDGGNGTRSVGIVNKAIAGTYMRQALDLLKAEGPGNAYIIIMVGGTNEGQANSSPDTFAAMIDEFVTYCTGLGRVPVWVEPWMWYSSALIGGAGQETANYDGAAELREAGKRQMMKYGDSALCITTTHQLPAPLPEYFNSGKAALLRDAIHQDQLGYRLYAEIIASSILDWYAKVDFTARAIPQWWCGSSATIDNPSSITGKSVNAKVNLSGFADGSVILTLPRWARPNRARNFTAPFTTNNTAYSIGVATVNTTGQVSLTGITSASATVYLDLRWD